MEDNNEIDVESIISDDDTGYFAAMSPESCVKVLEEKTESWYLALNTTGYFDKVRDMYYAWHGAYNSGVGEAHQLSFGDDGEVDLPVNHLRNIGRHMLTMVTSVRPAMETRAVNTDAKSQIQTKLGNGLLDYYMRASGKGLEERLKMACEYAISLGSGWIKMSWNPNAGEMTNIEKIMEAKKMKEMGEEISVPLPEYEGDVEFSNLSPFDVIEDLYKEDVKQDWKIARSFKNRWDLIRTYPELADELKKVNTKDQIDDGLECRLESFGRGETDDIPIYEFYHRRSEALPDGRYILYCDSKTIMYDGPLPYRRIPLYSIKPARILGTPLGYTDLFDLLPLQDTINMLYGTIATNQAAFGVQTVLVPTGCNIDPYQVSEGLSIMKYNPQMGKPEPMQLTATAPETFNFLDRIIGAAETLSGMNSVVRGNPEANLRSGSAIAMVQSNAIQYMSGLQAEYVHITEDVGLGLLNMLIDFGDSPRIADIVGDTGSSYVKQFKGEDLRGINRVIVDSANPLSKTLAGRMNMADNLLQYGEITSKQYMSVMQTGNLDTATDNAVFEEIRIKEENEMLLDGESPIVTAIDMHNEHILNHRSVISDPRVLKQSPELAQVVLQHIQEHINALRNTDPDLLMAIGQQPLQKAPQQAPSGAGAPPAGGVVENPTNLPPEEQAVQQVGAQPQGGPQMPEGFESAPITPEQNLAKIQGA